MKLPTLRSTLIREPGDTDAPTKIGGPRQVYEIGRQLLADADREHFVVLLLNTQNKPIGVNTVSIGTLNSSIVHPREVFKPAILASAASIVAMHNHPSGDPEPSDEDIEVTKKLDAAGKLLGIPCRDHVIIGEGRYVSLRERFGGGISD